MEIINKAKRMGSKEQNLSKIRFHIVKKAKKLALSISLFISLMKNTFKRKSQLLKIPA